MLKILSMNLAKMRAPSCPQTTKQRSLHAMRYNYLLVRIATHMLYDTNIYTNRHSYSESLNKFIAGLKMVWVEQ